MSLSNKGAFYHSESTYITRHEAKREHGAKNPRLNIDGQLDLLVTKIVTSAIANTKQSL